MSEAPFQLSDKWGDNILLVRGETYEDFLCNMIEAFGQAGTDSRMLGFQSKQTSGHVISQVVTNAQNGGIVTEPAATNSTARQCPHGQMKLIEKYNSWFCPLDKSDSGRCKPIDAKTGRAWK